MTFLWCNLSVAPLLPKVKVKSLQWPWKLFGVWLMVLQPYPLTLFWLLWTDIIPLQPHWPPPWPSNMSGVLLPQGPCASCCFSLECSASEICRACSLPQSGLYLNIVLSVRLIWIFCLSCISSSLSLTPFPILFFPYHHLNTVFIYLSFLLPVSSTQWNVNSVRTGIFFLFCSLLVLRTLPGTKWVLNKYFLNALKNCPFQLDYPFYFLFLPDPVNTKPNYF